MAQCKPTPEGKRLIRAMAKARLEMGETDAHAIIDGIHAAIADFSPMDKGEIAAIVGGFEDVPKALPTRSDLSERLSQLRRDLKAIYKPGAKDEAKNAARQKAIRKEIDRINDQIARGEFTKQPRPKPVYDRETMRLQAELEQARLKADREMRKIEWRGQSPIYKATTFATALMRASILSGLSVVEHLLGASVWRTISTAAEDALWAGIRHLPGMKELDRLAPIEGGGFGAGGIAAGAKELVSKETLKAIKDKIIKGASDRQVLYGKKGEHDSPYPLLDMVGHIHDAIKTPLEQYAFGRAYWRGAKQMRRSLARRGLDADAIDKAMVTDSAMAALNTQAYAESQAAKLQGKNGFVDQIQQALRAGDRTGPIGQMAVALIRMEMPIMKIPMNYAAEFASYAAGVPKALSKAYAATRNGASLTPEAADYIVRNIKKQGVGAVIGALAWNFPEHFGGLYRPGKDPSNPNVATGDVKFGDVPVSHHWLHAPAFGLGQAVAMTKQVYEQDMERARAFEMRGHSANYEKNIASDYDQAAAIRDRAKLSAAAQSIMSVLGDLPVFSVAKDVEKIGSGGLGAQQFVGDKLRDYVPVEVRKYAERQDTDNFTGKPTKRYPKSITEELELAIPGLRTRVSDQKPPRAPRASEE